jgi:putative transposase
MPRVARGLADGLIYHIINRGNARQQVFHTEGDYRAFVDLMAEAGGRYPVKVLAWCIMPNHFHLLVSPERADDLSRWMQWFMTSHVRRYHRFHKSSGHIWQGRYKSFIVQEDKHLLTVVRYIEGNPVRAHIVPTARDWAWSSHLGRAAADSPLTSALPITLPSDWTGYVDQPLSEGELERMRTSMQRQTPFGSPPWQMRICQELGLESTLNPKGRPRKWGQEK